MVGNPNAMRVRRKAGLGNKKASVNNLPKFGNEILKKPRSANTKIQPDAKYESGRALGKNAGNKKKTKKTETFNKETQEATGTKQDKLTKTEGSTQTIYTYKG